jgi:hypothetical protein
MKNLLYWASPWSVTSNRGNWAIGDLGTALPEPFFFGEESHKKSNRLPLGQLPEKGGNTLFADVSINTITYCVRHERLSI